LLDWLLWSSPHRGILSIQVYNRFKQSEREKRLFSLKGQKNASKRMTIYTFLLSHMADEHRSEGLDHTV